MVLETVEPFVVIHDFVEDLSYGSHDKTYWYYYE